MGRTGRIVPVGGIDYTNTGYKQIAEELYREGIGKDSVVFVPVGDGTLFRNLVEYFEEKAAELEKDPREIMPRFEGVTIPQNVFGNGNGLSELADKLDTSYSRHKKEIEYLCKKYGHAILTVQDNDIKEELVFLKKIGMQTCKTSATAFAAAKKYAEEIGR